MGHPGSGLRSSRQTDERIESGQFNRQARLKRTWRWHYQPGRRRSIAHARRNQRCRALCDRGDCAALVGISRCDRSANQACCYPGICTAASLGSSAFAGRCGSLPISVESECEKVNSMTNTSKSNDSADPGNPPHRFLLPGFIADGEIGLGDVIKRATSYFGIQPCGGCEHRSAALNRWMVFTNRQSK